MYKILIATKEPGKAERLTAELSRGGFTRVVVAANDETLNSVAKQDIDLILLDSANWIDSTQAELLRAQLQKIKLEKQLSVIALVLPSRIHEVSSSLGVDDFVVEPYQLLELTTRVRRLLHRNNRTNREKIISCGGLLIDSDKCEVHLDDRELALTFKEYELLKFLAANKGKVFSRDTLLNEVWGYDYYGGDRTVDVHIRRLRSKIEDPNHTFIDTVRNIGYKFREENHSPALEFRSLPEEQYSLSFCCNALNPSPK